MAVEERHQKSMTWIAWILAVAALFGINALGKADARMHRNSPVDEIGLSMAAEDPGTVPCNPEPLVMGPPTPSFDRLSPALRSNFAKREAAGWLAPSNLGHRATRERAPPPCA